MYNIALDGPSGAGKSTIARLLAKRLGILYLDTGALYRAVGLKAYERGWECVDSAVRTELENTEITVRYDKLSMSQSVYLDGKDVSADIRQHFVSDYGSRFSALRCVREKLLGVQRDIAAKYDSVLDGRDIGTCVLPEAKYKFFLTASADERARRRYNELIHKGETGLDIRRIKADIEERDERDKSREIAPLKKAVDAIEIDSTELSIDEVVEKIISYVKELIEN